MKNLLTQWETEEENQKTGGNVPLIDREHNGDVLLIDRAPNGDVLLIHRAHARLEMMLNVHLLRSSQNW